jgi:acetyl esterase/lipase
LLFWELTGINNGGRKTGSILRQGVSIVMNKSEKSKVLFHAPAAFIAAMVFMACVSTGGTVNQSGVGQTVSEQPAVSGPGAASHIMQVFTINLSNENVTLTCYLNGVSPKLRNTIPRPGILILPGGGFTATSDSEAEPVALAWLAEGYNAFVLRYTVGRREDRAQVTRKALTDAEEALELIRKNTEGWNTDADRIACVGFSAGAQVAAMLGTKGRVKPNALILGYAAILNQDSQGRWLTNGIHDDVDANTPRTFLFATRKDNTVSPANSLLFAGALEKAGIDFEIHIFQEGVHGLSLGRAFTSDGQENMVNREFSQWLSMSAAWLRISWGDFPLGDEWGATALNKFGVLDTPVSFLAKNPELWAAIVKVAPMLEQIAQYPQAADYSLSTLAPQIPMLTPELLSQIEAAAKKYSQ